MAYFIDLGEVWVFRIHYMKKNFKTDSAVLHYVQSETFELIHTEELTHLETELRNNYSASHFPPFLGYVLFRK